MLSAFVLALAAMPRVAACQSSHLFVWAGGTGTNDFMATIDANPSSKTYGRVLATTVPIPSINRAVSTTTDIQLWIVPVA